MTSMNDFLALLEADLKGKGNPYESKPDVTSDELAYLAEGLTGKKSPKPSKKLEADKEFHCNIDTEYTHKPLDLASGEKFKQVTITVQLREINQAQGVIYCHPDVLNVPGFKPRHKVFQGLTPIIDYMSDLGWDIKGLKYDSKQPCEKVLNIHLYAFFAVAELFRVFLPQKGESLHKTIKELALPNRNSNGRIVQTRRVMTETRIGFSYENYVDIPEWQWLIDGVWHATRLTIVDACAIHGAGSYADLCKNAGVELKYKDIFTKEEKGDMLRMYIERADEYDNYALGDLYVSDALKGNAEKFRGIYDALGIGEYFCEPKLTIGSTVSKIFEGVLLKHIGENDRTVLNGLCKHGTSQEIKEISDSTGLYLAKVDGGRCRNNRPFETVVKAEIADIDISGCYGEGLRNQLYPIGRPVIIDYTLRSDNNKYLTLRQFLKSYQSELVPGLWKARVSCKAGYTLKHRQDFLVSWYPPKDLKKILTTDTELESVDWWTVDNVGETKIFYNEVNLAVITHDFVQWLDNICGKHQRAELLDNLVVNCAMFYPLSQKVNSYEELLAKIENHKGKNSTRYEKRRTIKISAECNAWYGVNIGELLITSLLLERKKHPKKTPLNELFKLCTNTTYGIMVSPFFTIGNCCVGDNITARARAMAWYMEKGLNGFQTITDGCAFELNRVVQKLDTNYLTAESFAPMNNKGMYYSYGVLTDSRNFDEVASKSLEHLQNLFPNVDVLHQETTDVYGNKRKGQFGFELKGIFAGGVFHGSGNYAFYNAQGDIESLKMRSYRKNELQAVLIDENDELYHLDNFMPSRAFFTGLWNDASKLERSKPYLHNSILKLSGWASDYWGKWELSTAFPGCTIFVLRILRELSLSQFTFKTRKQWLEWNRRTEGLKHRLNQSFEAMYCDGDGNLNYTAMVKAVGDAIANDENLLGNNAAISSRLSEHPQNEAYKRGKEALKHVYGFDMKEHFELFGVVEE